MPGIHLDNNGIEWITTEVQAGAPSAPAASNAQVWFESDGLHIQDASSNEAIISFSGASVLQDLNIIDDDVPTLQIIDTTNTVTLAVLSDDTESRIGTTTTHPLKLVSDNTVAITLDTSQNATFVGNIISTNAGTPTISVTETDNTVTAFIASDGVTGLVGTSTNHSLILQTNSTDAITIDNAQDVTFAGDITIPSSIIVATGLTGAPTNDANGYIYRTNTSGGSYPFTAFGNLVIQPRTSSAADIVFMVGTTSPSVAMSIDGTNGNVGIGNLSAPEQPLHVRGTSGATAVKVDDLTTDSTVTLTFENDAREWLFGVRTDDKFYFRDVTGGTNLLAFDLSGQVGIGTLTPGAKLDVSGTANIGDTLSIDSILTLLADQTTDTLPTDDTSRKKLTLQKLASPPSNAAYIAFLNNPGTDTFYLIMEEG